MIPAPEAFKAYRQFILWSGDKVPIDPQTLRPADPHDPATRLDYQTAASMADLLGPGYGIGFVFTDNDPFFFLDIDHCGPDWSPLARQLCQVFAGCAVEVSISGAGLHVFGSGPVPPHSCKNIKAGLEFYTSLRFAALTGTGLTGDAAHVPPAETVKWLVDTYFTPGALLEPADWTDGPCEGYGGPADDLQLIDRMLASRSVSSMFGGRASVLALWTADVDALANAYPAISDTNPFDHSSADAALCAHLAFWTGKDCERMDRLFRMSGLVRGKWLDREKYRRDTILKAVAGCRNVLGARETPAVPGKPSTLPGPTVQLDDKTGFQFLSPSQQKEHFAGCVYVRNLHRVFVPDGGLIGPEQFKVQYGGYIYALDDTNSKSTADAWKVFTQSQAVTFPKAHSICFRPECTPGAIIHEEGDVMVNTYVPAQVASRPGDASRFINHVKKLIPDERDRQILLSYMAACVQYPGVKFQWATLVQGTEGNGKTLLATCIAHAIGWKHSHFPNAHDLTNKFNSWIVGKRFICIEEICVGSDKQDMIEVLKPLITNLKIETQGKGQDQQTTDNRANFSLYSNYKDGIRKTRNDRRYCVFYTAQQSAEDLRRDGMTGSYFPSLYNWLRTEGYAIVTNFLQTYQIPDEFNPAGVCHRAPETTSTGEALLMSMGGLEQEILDSIEEGRYGFANGWISSCAFSDLLKSRKDEKRIPHNKRRMILENMGYIQHPGLKEGRVNNIIPVEGGKPKLYIKKGHPDIGLIGVAAIVKAYTRAQEG